MRKEKWYMDRKSEFENKVEEIVKDFSDLSYEEIADSLNYIGAQYAIKGGLI